MFGEDLRPNRHTLAASAAAAVRDLDSDPQNDRDEQEIGRLEIHKRLQYAR